MQNIYHGVLYKMDMGIHQMYLNEWVNKWMEASRHPKH